MPQNKPSTISKIVKIISKLVKTISKIIFTSLLIVVGVKWEFGTVVCLLRGCAKMIFLPYKIQGLLSRGVLQNARKMVALLDFTIRRTRRAFCKTPLLVRPENII